MVSASGRLITARSSTLVNSAILRREDTSMARSERQTLRLQADGAQLLHRMLGWLGLGFAGGGDVRHQRQVHQHGALGADFRAQLADGLEEGLRLDVAHRTADLHQGPRRRRRHP